MNKSYTVLSPAKVNLGLKILNKRTDGYHNLYSLFIELDFGDVLLFSSSDSFSLSCEGFDVPLNDSNLISKAYKMLHKSKPDRASEFNIHINKIIPIGSGLGGGSSNASTTMKFLNQIWDLNYSSKKLEKIGKTIGADIPFFINGGFQIAEGIGDKLKPLKNNLLTDLIFLLVVPPIKISTEWAYKNIKYALKDTKRFFKFVPLELPIEWQLFKNDFEKVVISTYPEIGIIKQKLMNEGAIWSGLSGSGSTVYGIFRKSEFNRNININLDFPDSYQTILTNPKINSG